jgi:hypothetical protein
MTIRLDEQAHTVIARRAAVGRDTGIRVQIIALRGCQWMLQVDWGRRCPRRAPAVERVDDVALPPMWRAMPAGAISQSPPATSGRSPGWPSWASRW